MRNERHPAVASNATRVHKHQLGACGHGGQSHHAYIGGPRGVLADSRAPFCEYAMRGSPRAHPTLLVSPSTKRTYAVMMGVSTMRISEAPGVNIAYWRPDLRMRNARQSGAALRSLTSRRLRRRLRGGSRRIRQGVTSSACMGSLSTSRVLSGMGSREPGRGALKWVLSRDSRISIGGAIIFRRRRRRRRGRL